MSITFNAQTADGEWPGVSVNQSNTNALQTMVSLGFDEGLVDYSGSIPADDLRALIVFAQAGLAVDPSADDGTAAYETKLPGRATMIECGLRPGYFTDVYARLDEVAQAAGPGGVVTWG